MHWVYLSPHYDDAIYSCGAAIWTQVQSGDSVEIWTICAGNPPADRPLTPFAAQLHARWGLTAAAVAARQAEDTAACAVVGAAFRRFDIPDCIYRYNPFTNQPVVNGEEDLHAHGIHPEPWLVQDLTRRLAADLQPSDQVVAPLAVGDHTDHLLVMLAALALGKPLWRYPDVPYVLERMDINAFYQDTRQVTPQRLTGPAIAAWQAGAAAYGSQLSTFWSDRCALDAALQGYADQGGGRLFTRDDQG